MLALSCLALGLVAGLVARSIIHGTENAITKIDQRERDDLARRQREWMALNHEDRKWYNRFGGHNN